MGRQDKRLGGVVMGYHIEERIGWGASSKVYRGRHTLTGQVVAIKIINKPRSRIGDLQRMFSECTLLEKLQHPNIVEMKQWFETEKHVYIVMELAKNGDFLDLVNKRTAPFSEETLKTWFAQLVDALAYAHSRGYVHKDVKLDNILLDGHRILLADWGYAHTFSAESLCTNWAGTEGYWAPEIILHRPFAGPEVDCWSLGVTLFALSTGRLPFDRRQPNYNENLIHARFTLPTSLSPELRSLICGLITADPVARYTLRDVQAHPFYTTAKLPNFSPVIERAAMERRLTPDSTNSPAGSAIRQRRVPAKVVTVTKLRDTNDAPLVESASLSSFEGLVREPPSPPQSAPSSRSSSRQGSRIGDRKQEQDVDEKEEEVKPVAQAQPAQPAATRGAEEEEKKKAKKFRPLHSVISSLKKLSVVKVFA